MPEVRHALFAHLEARDDASNKTLRDAAGAADLPAARGAAKDDPASAEAVSRVLALMLLAGSGAAEVIDAAKAAAARAPREGSGNDVALVAGKVLWALGSDPQQAEPYYRRVRRSEPAHPEVLAFYRELFADKSKATQLIQVLVQARRASTDKETRFRLAGEEAELAEQRLGSSDRAIETWRSLIREDGSDPRASESLMRLYREGGKWTALVDLLKGELERLGDGEKQRQAKIDKLLEIADLYGDKLKLDTMALATLQRILEIDPRHERSLEALSETYAKAGRFSDLLGVYQKRVDAAQDVGDTTRQVELLRKVSEIWVTKLGNPQRALEPLHKVLRLAPKDAQARGLLARIHEERRDFRALIGLRREELADLEGNDALQLRIELARLAEDKLGDRREAIEAWNEVLSHHGEEDVALAALARLYERESRWAHAAEILHRKLRTCTREQAVALLQHLGGLYGDRLQNRDDAVRVWKELLRLQPGHDKATRRLRDAYVASRRWDALTELYAGQGRLHDVVEVLQSAADRIGDVEERVALYRRVASLCSERLGQPERALKALERTLAIQPDNLDVARELLPIYREQSNWARLMSTYEVLLNAAGADSERLELIAAMQEVAEHKLASTALTLQWAAAAYRIDAKQERLREGLEAAAERADGWDELTRIFEERIAAKNVPEREHLLLLEKLAVIARDRLFKPDDAQRYFRRIIAADPSNGGAMAALEDIYSSTRRWDDLSEVYRRRLEVTEQPAARLATMRGLAKIQEDHLADLDAAATSYRSILELAPEDTAALQSLARIFRNRGKWAELADVLERELELTDSDTTRVPVMFELGQIHATRLQQSSRAVTGFLAVLEIDPNHRAAVAALEALREADPSTSLAVMRGLLPYYRRVEDRPKEAEAMEVIVGSEEDGPRRLQLLEQLAGTYEKMEERREDALRIRDRLFRADPSQWNGRQILQRLGNDLGRVTDVAAAYEAVLALLAREAGEAEAEGRTMPRERATLRRDLLLEYAAMLRDQLSRPRDAEAAYTHVLDMDETHQGGYEALEALLRARSANEDLRALYRRRVDVTFNQREQKDLLSRIIDLSRTLLGDRSTAVATAEELLDLIPDDLPTIGLLVDMYGEGTDHADYEKLEEILGRQAELMTSRSSGADGDDARARRIRVRRAGLRMQYLGDAFGAVDLLGQVLGDDPDDEEARHFLEELLAISEVQLQACALLEPIYERVGDHLGRIRVLRVRREQAASAGATDDAVGYLLRAAAIYESELQDPATGFSSVREAYLMDPTRYDTRQEVERLGVLQSRFGDLVEVWRLALRHERVADRGLEIDLTTRLARLLDEHMRDQEGARQAYSDLLALDPPDASLAREAVSKLCRLHLEAGDGVALVRAKRELLRFMETPADQVRIRLEIATVQLDLRDRVGAALTYSEVLDMQPANVTALDQLEALFREEAEWARLVQVLEHRIGVTQDARSRSRLWRQLGEIGRDKLREPNRAIEAFQSVLALKVGRDDTAGSLRALVDLYEGLSRWPDVEEALRRLTTIAETEDVRVELLTRSATIVGKRLGRGQDALDLLKRVLDLAPTDARARSEVQGYLEHDETRERAIRILSPLFEAEKNWPALLELEELQARKQPSGRRRLQALLRVATTQEERIGDADRAFGVLCEAMAEAADQPELEGILEKVERLGAEKQRAEGLLDAYEATVDHILDAGLQQRVLRAQGEVALQRLSRLPVARKAYERVLELSPDDAAAADALEQIYLRQDEHEPLAELLVSRADRAGEQARRDDALVRAAEIYRKQLGRAEDAIRLYERLSAEGIARADVQDVMEPLYEQTERWRELASHLNRKLTRLGGKQAVETHLRLGRLYGEKLQDSETGIRHLSAALKLDPDQAVATEELDRYLEDPTMRGRVAQMLEPVFAAVGDWNRLIQIQEIRLAEAADDESRMRILIRIAQIEEEQLEDLERAMASYERLFREQPTSRSVRDQLSRLSAVLGQTQRYAALLTDFAQGEGAADDTDDMLAIVREAADLWSGVLRAPAQAVPLLRRIRAAQPEDAAVFIALEQTLTQAEMWKDLALAYWTEIDAAMAEDRQIELLRKLATLSLEMLEDKNEAARAYQRMLEIRPGYEIARMRLEQIFTETNRHSDLLDLLRERLDRTTDPDERSETALRIAGLQDGPLEESEGAVDTIEAMLGDSPNDTGAVRMLEVIAQNRRELRPRVLGILRPIYESLGNIGRIVEIDEWQLAHTEDPVQRHELYREMAELQARTPERAEPAFRTLTRALCEPGPEHVLESLDAEVARMAGKLDMNAAFADALVTAAGAEGLESDIDRRLDLLVRAATLLADLGDTERSAQTLREALELREDDAGALELLDTVLTRLGYHDEQSGVLRRRAEVAEDDRDRVAILRRLAVLLEEVLMRPEQAEQAWKELLALEPGDREALRRLSRVYEQSGSTTALIDVLERQIETTNDLSERRDLRMQLASLQRETVKDRSAEIEVLRALLTDSPADDDALAALARALQAESRFAEAVDIVQERAQIAGADERKAALTLEAARLYSGPLSDVPSALERYEAVLELQPGQDGALQDLVALAKLAESFEAAGNLVIQQLENVARWADLDAVLSARAELTQDPEENTEALRQLAKVRLEREDDPEGALAALVALLQVVDEAGLPDVLDRSGRLAVQLGRAPQHVQMLAARAESDDVEGAVRVTIGLHAATLAEEVMGEPELALSILVPLVDAGLANEAVDSRAERIGRATGDLAAVEKALSHSARGAEGMARADALTRLGETQLERGDLDGALESFRDAFEQGHDRASVRGLEKILARSETPAAALLDALDTAYQAEGDRSGQAKIAAQRLATAHETDRPRLLEQLGVLRDEGGGTPAEALEAWGELLRHDVDSANALDRTLQLGKSSQELMRRAVELMGRAIADARKKGHTPVLVMLQTATAQLRDLSDSRAALVTVQALLEEQPDHGDALDLLVAAARKAGEAQILHDALGRAAQIQAEPEAAVTLLAEAATVAESAMGEPQLAIVDLEALLAIDESDGRHWQKLLALLTSAGDYDKLADVLTRRAAIAETPEERRDLRYRLANVLVDKLQRSDDAITTYQDMLGDRADDLEAMDELEVLLRNLERWEDVRDVLERRLEVVGGDDKVMVLEELAQLAENRLDDSGDASERYQQILVEKPGYEPAEAALQRLLSGEERWVDLSELLQQRADRLRGAGEVDGYRSVTSTLATLLAEKLQHPERAKELLDELLDHDPAYVPALLAKASVYEAMGEEGAVRLTLKQAADLDPQGAEGALLHLRLARMADDVDKRREHLEKALKLDPGNVDAGRELLELYRKHERWADLVYMLEIVAGRTDDADAKRELVLERVDLMLLRLSDPEGSLRVLAPLYKEVQDNIEINRRIADALFAAERFDEAQGMYKWLVEIGRRGKRSKTLGHFLTRLARIELRSEEAKNNAKEQLLEAYRIDTTNVETLMTLGQLHEAEDAWRDALKIYRTMLLQNADQSGLMRRGDIYRNLARAHVALEEKPKAKAMLRRGLEEDSDHPDIGEELAALED